MVEVDHKYFIFALQMSSKLLCWKQVNKYNIYDIVIEFKIVMVATYHKFHNKILFYQ
jgi:hypothetical protein